MDIRLHNTITTSKRGNDFDNAVQCFTDVLLAMAFPNLKTCLIVLVVVVLSGAQLRKKVDDKIKCPKVKAMRNFDLERASIVKYFFKVSTTSSAFR